MNFNHRTPKVVLTIVFAAVLAACGSTKKDLTLDNYNFNYKHQSKESGIPLIQVFDDGVSTFFHFQATRIPAIFAETPNGYTFYEGEKAGPYIKLPVLAKSFVLKLQSNELKVDYSGGKREFKAADIGESLSVERERFGHLVVPGKNNPAPDIETKRPSTYSYSDQIKGDTVYWTSIPTPTDATEILFVHGSSAVPSTGRNQLRNIAKNLKGSDISSIEVLGYNDASDSQSLGLRRAEAAANVLVLAGVDKAKIRTRVHPVFVESMSRNAIPGAMITGYRTSRLAPQSSFKPIAAGQVIKTPVKQHGSTSIDVNQVMADIRAKKISPSEARKLIANAKAEYAATASIAGNEVLTWDLRKSDGSMSVAVQRWASANGYKVEFKDFPYIPVVADTSFEGRDFLSAVEHVMAESRKAGYAVSLPEMKAEHTILLSGDKQKRPV